MPAPGDILDLEISAVAHGGVFVARYGNPGADGRGARVVFVSDAVVGERVRARLTETRKGFFWRAETLEVITASAHRQPHVWTAADITLPPERRAGGADFGHIRLSEQRRLKSEVITDALSRFGGVSFPVTVQPAPTETRDGTGGRTRVRLQVDGDGLAGPYAARSHRVIAVADLPLATDGVARAFAALDGVRPGRIDLVQPADGEVRVLSRPVSRVDHRATAETVIEHAFQREFRVAADGFWQVHRAAAQTLTVAIDTAAAREAVARALADPDACHLDLYGGAGLFSAALEEASTPAARIICVESDARAAECARANLPRAEVITARVDRWLREFEQRAETNERAQVSRGVVVLDPPRSGAGAEVVRRVAAIGPRAVIYIACDPVALARDVRTFREHGFELVEVLAWDLFPNTHHLEAMAVLLPPG